MTPITGGTRIWGILADPIHHVRTPQVLNALMQQQGIDGVMVPMHVAPADLAGFVAGLRMMRNLHGFIVTVPHKSAALPLCDSISDAARQCDAVNAVRRLPDGSLSGTMLDGEGFVAGLRAAGIAPQGRDVYLAGAGGAASAVAFALAHAGVASLTIANRTRARAEALLKRIADAYPGLPLRLGTETPPGQGLLVNGTSLGLNDGDALPFETAGIGSGHIVAEMVMRTEMTPLLAAAAARGARIHPGLPMLTSQAGLMASFLGMTP